MIRIHKLRICALKNYNLNSRKIRNWTRIWTSDLQISSLPFYHLSYPGSIDGTCLNLSLESNAMQGVVICDTVIIWPAGLEVQGLNPGPGSNFSLEFVILQGTNHRFVFTCQFYLFFLISGSCYLVYLVSFRFWCYVTFLCICSQLWLF